jgi:hypothetical protein
MTSNPKWRKVHKCIGYAQQAKKNYEEFMKGRRD